MIGRTVLGTAIGSTLLLGCRDNVSPPRGDMIGPLTYEVSDFVATTDGCETHDSENPLDGAFEVTIDGDVAVMKHSTLVLDASTLSYHPDLNTITMLGDSATSEFDSCRVEFFETFTLTLDEPDRSLDENETVQVRWDHSETDASATAGACDGVWFVPLLCSSDASFTLTRTPADRRDRAVAASPGNQTGAAHARWPNQ